jgi:hypothetical protein
MPIFYRLEMAKKLLLICAEVIALRKSESINLGTIMVFLHRNKVIIDLDWPK